MKTAVIDNNNIVLKSAEDIKLDGKKGAVVKVSGCGLCGSDIVKFVHKIAKDGTVLGHEIVAEIVDINSETEFKKGDVIVLADELIPKDKYTLINPVCEWKQTTITNYNVRELQVPIYVDGVQVYELPNINERKEYCNQEFNTIYPEVKRSLNPHEYYVDLSKKLLELKKQLIESMKGKQLVKCEKKS